MAFPFLAAAQLVSGGLSMLKGAKQKREAKKMAEGNTRPDMPIPSAILEAQKMSKSIAQEGMPSEQYTKGLKNIDRSATNALRGATDRRGGLAAVGQIQGTTNDALGNLNVQDANMRQRNQMNLINQTNQLGRYQQNAWDWNKRQKFLETANAARALMGAGAMNANQGLDRLLTGAAEGGAYAESALSGKGGSYIPKQGGLASTSGDPRTYGSGSPSQSMFQSEFSNDDNLDNKLNNFMSTRQRLSNGMIPRYNG